MKRIIRIIIYVLLITFFSYTMYRNLRLHVIPSVDLIKDEATATLYQRLIPTTSNLVWKNFYYSHDDIKQKDIPEAMRYNIAYKNTTTSSSNITEDALKNGYEKVFGPNTYKKVDSFIGGCNSYTYDESEKVYKSTKRTVCQNTDISVLSRIVDASASKTKMDITVVVVYINETKKEVYKYCNEDMSKCSGIIKKDIIDFDERNIDITDKSLKKYRFTYKKIDDEYYFDSIKKIK